MRKVLFIGLIVVFLGSCSVEDPIVNDYYDVYVPVENVSMPDSFELGQSYEIEYTYYRPSTCHIFNGLFYNPDVNEHILAIQNRVYPNLGPDCADLADDLITRIFNFTVNSNDTHTFRFWKGKDDSGQDIYLEFEVPVN